MNKFNGMALVVVKSWNTDNVDKNGLSPVLLQCLAGTMPNRSIISGTIAQREGLYENSTYLVQITETETDDKYGRQFNFTNVGQASLLEIISAKRELGAVKVFDASEAIVEESEEVPAKKAKASAIGME